MHPHISEAREGDGILFKGILTMLQSAGKSTPLIYPLLQVYLAVFTGNHPDPVYGCTKNDEQIHIFSGYGIPAYYFFISGAELFTAPLIETILLLVLSGLFNTYNHKSAKGAIFNINFGLGIASFLFFPSLTFIIWILLALMVMRPLRINELLLCLLGITAPFYFMQCTCLLPTSGVGKIYGHSLLFIFPDCSNLPWLAGSVFLLTVPFLMGGYYVQDNLRKMLIQARKGWSLLLLYLLGALLVPFVNNSATFENWVMAAIPFAAFHACTYLYSNLRIIPNLIFWLSVALVLAFQYTGPGW